MTDWWMGRTDSGCLNYSRSVGGVMMSSLSLSAVLHVEPLNKGHSVIM